MLTCTHRSALANLAQWLKQVASCPGAGGIGSGQQLPVGKMDVASRRVLREETDPFRCSSGEAQSITAAHLYRREPVFKPACHEHANLFHTGSVSLQALMGCGTERILHNENTSVPKWCVPARLWTGCATFNLNPSES